jgi:hypothetical protein
MNCVCVHCGEPIGRIEGWGKFVGSWRHHPEDGPDAYPYCRCRCIGHHDAVLCCDGCEAEPDLKSINV